MWNATPGFSFFVLIFVWFGCYQKNSKNPAIFCIMSVSKFVFICFWYFSPSNSIFVNKWIMLFFTKGVFLIKIRFDILSFWTQVFPKNDENNIINESNTNFFDNFFPYWGFLSQLVVIPVAGGAASSRCKNTETRNIFNPSYEIIAASCEINMKNILIYIKYCNEFNKKHQKMETNTMYRKYRKYKENKKM